MNIYLFINLFNKDYSTFYVLELGAKCCEYVNE